MTYQRCHQKAALTAFVETGKSMMGVDAASLACPEVVRRLRLPCTLSDNETWFDYMGRLCFPKALEFVASLPVGTHGCINGPAGTGKSFLLAALAAFLMGSPNAVEKYAAAAGRVVYIDAKMFAPTPLEILLHSLSVAFAKNESVLEQLLTIKSCSDIANLLKQQQQVLYFMVDNGDALVGWQGAMEILETITENMVLIYCARASHLSSTDSDFVMSGFEEAEMCSFLKHKGVKHVDALQHKGVKHVDALQHKGVKHVDALQHCTGYIPLLLDAYCCGGRWVLPGLDMRGGMEELTSFIQGRFFRELDRGIFKRLNREGSLEERRLLVEILAGARLEGKAFRGLAEEADGILYKDWQGRGACMCEAIKRHASLRTLKFAEIGMEEVRAWLSPLVEGGSAASWNWTMAVASVVKLRRHLTVEAIGQTMQVNHVTASPWWMPWLEKQMMVDSTPMAWPAVTVAMEGKAFVLQAGMEDDLRPELYHEAKCSFLERAREVCDGCSAFHTYFLWIGCFGERVGQQGLVLSQGDFTDVFLNCSMLDPSLLEFEQAAERAASVQSCYHMVGKRMCKLKAKSDSLFCHVHARKSKVAAEQHL